MKGHYRVLPHEGVEAGKTDFAKDIERGLSEESKSIPSKYIYDEKGEDTLSHLAEPPEYYPTNCEYEILQNNKTNIAG